MAGDSYIHAIFAEKYVPLRKCRVCGHFELYSTDCPGSNFHLDRIKKEAGQEISYPGYLIKMNPSLKDKNVKFIQSKLIEKGYDVGNCGADGYFGEGTLDIIFK
jgi:N-acetylmuramoyl-L-alanine amidase